MKMDLPKRKNTRLATYDYSQNAGYFVTICTKDRREILSQIVGGGIETAPKIQLTPIGAEIVSCIEYIGNNYNGVVIDKYVIMPNHIHLIVILEVSGHGNPPLQNVIAQLKSYTTRQYNCICKSKGELLWQKSFHDHIIRNQEDYRQIWQYIDTNPFKWDEDTYYKM